MSLAAMIRENDMTRFSEDKLEFDVIFSNLTVPGYAVTLGGAATAFLLFIGVLFVLEHNTRVLSQEKFRVATNMARRMHAPLLLLRNRMGECMEGGVYGDKCKRMEMLMGHVELAIVSCRNIMILDRMDREPLVGTGTDLVEINRCVRTVAELCRPYAESHRVRIEVRQSEEKAGCRSNGEFMAAALQFLLSGMIDITEPGGCIHITVSKRQGGWMLRAANQEGTDGKAPIPALPITVHGELRTAGKMIRMHGGKLDAYRHGKSIMCRVFVPAEPHAWKETGTDLSRQKRDKSTAREMTATSKKEVASIAGSLPNILVVMEDNMFRSYLKEALAGEFNVATREKLDMEELAGTGQRPDAILIDENVNGTCGETLCARIKEEEKTALIPVMLLVGHDDSGSFLAHAKCEADRIETRTDSPARMKTDIHMLIGSCGKMCRRAVRSMEENNAHVLQRTMEQEDNLRFINKVRKLIEENMDKQGYTVDRLCDGMGMSRTAFYNKLKGITGKHPMEYVFNFKMERARILLASGRYNVTEVADMLGYCDAKYFGKRFKAFYHKAPTCFMKEV